MNVFLSWSGQDSKEIALGLKAFLPGVLPSVDVWMSAKDIPPGGLWKSDLHKRLLNADFGVVCVTASNTQAPWLLYELGCLAMRVPANQLVPILSGIENREVPEPLNSFQALYAHREGVWQLVLAINSTCPNPQDEASLLQSFEQHWPSLEESWSGGIDVATQGDVQVVRIGTGMMVDENSVAMFRRKLQKLIHSGSKLLVIDLSELRYLSSAGLGAFVLNWRIAESVGGKIALANPCEAIRSSLRVSQMDKIFEIHDDVESAIESLQGPAH